VNGPWLWELMLAASDARSNFVRHCQCLSFLTNSEGVLSVLDSPARAHTLSSIRYGFARQRLLNILCFLRAVPCLFARNLLGPAI
jgi:hypothetical protein